LKRISVKYSVLACFIIIANFTGCGVKGNPVILSTVPGNGKVVQNFKAAVSDNAVILKCDFYGKDLKINSIALEKSEVGSAGNECKNCPRTFERINQVSLKEIKQDSNGYGTYNFTDGKVTHGKTYNYRLLLCDDFNNCLENAIIEMTFK